MKRWRTIFLLLFLFGISLSASAQTVKSTEPDRGGEIDLAAQDPAEALKNLVVQEGFEVTLFASEKEFPIYNPVALNFDGKGRLWVVTMPSYPQRLPDEDPNDMLIILEDADNDGKADKHTIFADKLHVPTGFELGDGGAYIAQQPNVIFAKDTDGDDVADERETIIHGMGTEDSHHAVHAFTWGPDGGLYFQEGTFHHTQIETPYGPTRLVDAGILRHSPLDHRTEVFVSYGFANPWGHVFDEWGQNFIADASGGSNYYGSAMTGNIHYPKKHGALKVFTSVVRPTAGCEFVRSRQFPDEAQGNFLVNNCIGFQGIKQHRVIEEDSGFTSEEVEPLLYSTDTNFRPVDIEFGPDGALYIVDWFNPLIGHMQYSLRDPRRDHGHGRIWRIAYKGKPALTPPVITDATILQLLENLKLYENRARYRSRIELRSRDRAEVLSALKTWVAELDAKDPLYEHNLLEALWVNQVLNNVDAELLERLLNAKEPRARAAAVRVARFWRDSLPNAVALLTPRINDDFPRTRLEAILTLSYIETEESASAIMQALNHPTDYYLDYVLEEATKTLKPIWLEGIKSGKIDLAASPKAEQYLISRVTPTELTELPRTTDVLQATLTRSGVPVKDRNDALQALAKERGKSPLALLIDTIETSDSGSAQDELLLHNLGMMLCAYPQSELKDEMESIVKLSSAGHSMVVRIHALAATAVAQGDAQSVWNKVADQPLSKLDLVNGIAMIPDEKIRAQFYPLLSGLLKDQSGADDAAITAQYIRVELRGRDRTLTVAEVEAFDGDKNVALEGKATQSSTAFGGSARHAIDGNTDGRFAENGQTHTNPEENPWLEIDLRQARSIDRVRVWNRQDDDTGTRLQDYTLRLLDANHNAVFTVDDNPAPIQFAEHSIANSLKLAALSAIGDTQPDLKDLVPLLIETAGDESHREAALLAANNLSEEAFSAEQAKALGDIALAHIHAAPTALLSSRGVQNAFQVGQKLASVLPEAQAAELKLELANLGITVIHIRPVPHKMIYDLTEFSVPAGKPIEIVFENNDIMPHNLVFTAPGKMEEVGMKAEAMALDADAQERGYIPDTPSVLHHTKLLFPGDQEKLAFIAPAEQGDVPYVCTYPGHWLVMNGVMHVVAELDRDTLLAQIKKQEEQKDAPPARKMVKDWTLDDLRGNIEMVHKGRNFDNAKAMFEVAGCVKCHSLGGVGTPYGPDLLGENIKKYGTLELLQQMLEPNVKIDPVWDSYTVETADFESFTGFIVKQDDKEVHLKANQENPNDITVISKDNIDKMEKSAQSTMPTGMLVTLTQDDIYDLVAYIESGADPGHKNFQK